MQIDTALTAADLAPQISAMWEAGRTNQSSMISSASSFVVDIFVFS